MRVESDTVEDFEPAGRGLIARKSILQGEAVMQINMKFVMTKERAQAVLGKQVVPDTMGEYIAIARLLMHERLQVRVTARVTARASGKRRGRASLRVGVSG